MAKRKSISKKARFEIFKRDQFTCQYCGSKPPGVVLELDHILAVASGGGNESHNLITSCFDCNRGKSDGSLAQVPVSIEVSLKEQIERKEQLAAYNKQLLKLVSAEEAIANQLGRYWCNFFLQIESERNCWIVSQSRMTSLRQFLKRLSVIEIRESMELAASRIGGTHQEDEKAWKYFCGICWTKIRGGAA